VALEMSEKHSEHWVGELDEQSEQRESSHPKNEMIVKGVRLHVLNEAKW